MDIRRMTKLGGDLKRLRKPRRRVDLDDGLNRPCKLTSADEPFGRIGSPRRHGSAACTGVSACKCAVDGTSTVTDLHPTALCQCVSIGMSIRSRHDSRGPCPRAGNLRRKERYPFEGSQPFLREVTRCESPVPPLRRWGPDRALHAKHRRTGNRRTPRRPCQSGVDHRRSDFAR